QPARRPRPRPRALRPGPRRPSDRSHGGCRVVSSLPRGWGRVRLRDLGDEVRGSVKPDPTTTYELYSVPAYPSGRPEILSGEEIRSSKRPVEPGDVLLCKINPRINRVWIVAEPIGVGPQIASTEYLVFRTPDPV